MTEQPSSDNQLKNTSTGHNLSEASYLDEHFEAMRPEYEAMIRSVGIQVGWQVLDAGCGGGSYLHLLAELVGRSGNITALDMAPENIKRVKTLVNSGQLICPVIAEVGDVTSLPYEDDSFDAVWSANVSQYLTDEALQKMLAEFRRVVRSGGIVAVKEFDRTLHQFIPGDPVAYWNFSAARRFDVPGWGALRTPSLPIWFKKAGLSEIQHKVTICERRAPLRPVEQGYISSGLRYIAKMAEKLSLPEPASLTWHQLGDIDSPDHIMKQPDFYYREGQSVTVARVPRSPS